MSSPWSSSIRYRSSADRCRVALRSSISRIFRRGSVTLSPASRSSLGSTVLGLANGCRYDGTPFCRRWTMRHAVLAFLALSLCACGIIFKLPTRQGNVIEQKDLDKLQIGMSHQQVQFLLGTPIAASSLRPDRWDYLAYYKNPR